MRIARWALAVAALGLVAVPALAHHGKNCRPYTVEKVCWEKGRPCHLHMVYAEGHTPAGPVPDGYWYSAKPKKHAHKRGNYQLARHAKGRNSPNATCRGFSCWFQHAPQHRY
jgi:hypothetical protein